jgi:hypothetical protein
MASATVGARWPREDRERYRASTKRARAHESTHDVPRSDACGHSTSEARRGHGGGSCGDAGVGRRRRKGCTSCSTNMTTPSASFWPSSHRTCPTPPTPEPSTPHHRLDMRTPVLNHQQAYTQPVADHVPHVSPNLNPEINARSPNHHHILFRYVHTNYLISERIPSRGRERGREQAGVIM